MSEDLTGRRLGHYRIDGVLGRGGMSVMYKATDVRLGRKVALKIIGEHLGEDAEFRERFVDEARNTSAIDHANVVPLYDFGEVDGLLYIAMRLVDGSDLASLIKDGPISPQRTLSLLGQVGEALDTLHERGLVHLDVKPANVLVTSRESSSEHVYLADFGLTRRGATGHRTRSGDFLGSPTYAAPEHLRGEPVDGRTDAYSLACVLFACLTGRPPFQGKVPDVIKGHLNLDPPTVTGFVVLPGGIDEVIRRGMAKDPKTRYADCRGLIAAAGQALAPVARPGAAPVARPAMSSSGGPSSGGAAQAAPATGPRPVQHQQPQHQQQHPQAQYHQQQHQPQQPQPPQHQPQRQAHPSPQAGYQAPAQPSEPVRLRPPVPAGSTAFASGRDGNRWLVPVLVGVVALVAIVAAIFLLSGNDEPTTPEPPRSSVPEIPVGPGGGSNGSEPTAKSSERGSSSRVRMPSLSELPAG